MFLQFFAFDVEQLPDYDFVICGSILHHFTEDQARTVLCLMRKKAARRFLASDPERSPLAWIRQLRAIRRAALHCARFCPQRATANLATTDLTAT